MKDISDLNPHNYPTTTIIDSNLRILYERTMEIQDAYGEEITSNSGLRSEADQQDLIKSGKSKAIHSKHLVGAAVDINDPDGKFYAWCKANPDALERIGFWCEEREGKWQHLQILPPGSGKRWFYP